MAGRSEIPRSSILQEPRLQHNIPRPADNSVADNMYSQQDEAAPPRDRRAWTEEEDELLRSAIEQGAPATGLIDVPDAHA